MMSKYYFINKLETNNINKQDKQTIVIYRNYSSKTLDEALIIKIKKYCKTRSIKFYLSNDIGLAIKLDLDGAYIPSFNKNFNHLSYSLKKNFKIIGSAHNIKEIKAPCLCWHTVCYNYVSKGALLKFTHIHAE